MNLLTAILAASLEVIDALLNFYVWVLIVSAVMSWLVAFGIVNTYNRFIQVVGDFCFRLTEPVLVHIRRFVPPLGGLDLSFLVLVLAINFIQSFIHHLVL